VFLRKVRTASGATAVQIARRENRRDVVVEHLGSARTDAELAALMQVGRRKLQIQGQGVLDLGPEPDQDGAVVVGQVSRLLTDMWSLTRFPGQCWCGDHHAALVAAVCRSSKSFGDR